jgi:threonyl-tRNA synthetase
MSDIVIKVQLPDGSVQQVPQGTTPLEIARSISPRLADAALVARAAPLEATPSRAMATAI